VVHKFSKNLETTSKFWASEARHETKAVLRTRKY